MSRLNDTLILWIAENEPEVLIRAYEGTGTEPPVRPATPPGIVLSDPNRPRNYRDYPNPNMIPPPPAFKGLR